MDPLERLSSRRAAAGLLGLAVLAPALRPAPAAARKGWCRTDPVVTLDGRPGSIYVSANADERQFNNSSGDIKIYHPKDTVTQKIWEDPNGYLGQGISTNFGVDTALRKLSTHLEVKITCRIPASRGDIPILLEWAPGPVTWNDDGSPQPNPVQAAVEGRTNQWITLRGTLPYR